MVLPILICVKKIKMYDVVIIGGGLMGSCVTWQLSNRGYKVKLLEQQDKTYTIGSSLGHARITRALGTKDDLWAYLHKLSIIETSKLLAFLSKKEETEYSLNDIYTTSPVSYIFYKDTPKIGGFENVLNNKVAFCDYAFSKKECMDQFNVNWLDGTSAYVREKKKYSGTLNPDILIKMLHSAIRLYHQEVYYNSRVEQIKKNTTGYEVEFIHDNQVEHISCKNIICAAGAFTGRLLADIAPMWQSIIQPKRVFLVFFKPKKSVWDALSPIEKDRILEGYPAIYFSKELSFAMIEKFDTDGLPIIKIGGHFIRSSFQSVDTVWSTPVTKEEIDWAYTNTLDHLKSLQIDWLKDDLAIFHSYSCVYSLTEDEIPYLGPLVDNNQNRYDDFILMAGMSGVGAKGAMAYGFMAANHLEKKHPNDSAYLSALVKLSTSKLLR